MRHIPMPEERMHDFLSKLGIEEADLAVINTYKNVFVERKEEFGRFFFSYFHAIPTTRIILDRCDPRDSLRAILINWFENLFLQRLGIDFLRELWRSGLRHVELSLDQRYVNLGYAMVRNFCHKVIREDIPVEEGGELAAALDKYLDFCVLVATDSFITATSRCDREVILGIAHQVRNPTTIIGGGVRRLQKKLEASHPDQRIYEAILQENQRLERMMKDIGSFTSLFQDEPRFRSLSLTDLVHDVIETIKKDRDMDGIHVSLELDPSAATLFGDHRDLSTLLYYVLENSIEALFGVSGTITVRSSRTPAGPFVSIQIINHGHLPAGVPVKTLLEPFYSSKPTGTGFGLAIASVAVKRNQGDITIEQLPGGLVRTSVTLPLDEAFAGQG